MPKYARRIYFCQVNSIFIHFMALTPNFHFIHQFNQVSAHICYSLSKPIQRKTVIDDGFTSCESLALTFSNKNFFSFHFISVKFEKSYRNWKNWWDITLLCSMPLTLHVCIKSNSFLKSNSFFYVYSHQHIRMAFSCNHELVSISMKTLSYHQWRHHFLLIKLLKISFANFYKTIL